MQTTIALNPLPVAIMFLIIGLWLLALIIYVRQLRKRVRTLELVFELIRGDKNFGDVRTMKIPAGTDIRAGEAVFIAQDGKAYPTSLRGKD